jgi:hypothetical protein
MTDAEELKFVGLCLIDIGQSMRDLSAAFQQFCEKLRREAELAHDHLRRSRLFGQLSGKNKLKAGSRLLV